MIGSNNKSWGYFPLSHDKDRYHDGKKSHTWNAMRAGINDVVLLKFD
jgi:hypothetical protein